jgi:molybdenum cofactor biosynthesis enzyme MoaA
VLRAHCQHIERHVVGAVAVRIPFLPTSRRTAGSAPRILGALEYVDSRQIIGWALDPAQPDRLPVLEIMVGDTTLGVTTPSRTRPDVTKTYNLEGTFGFGFYASPPLKDSEIERVRVLARDFGVELAAARTQRVKADAPISQLLVNIDSRTDVLNAEPAHYEWVRIDPNLDCNLHCIYCHNGRSTQVFDLDDLKEVLQKAVLSAENVCVGCTMEPTLDPRLPDVFEAIASTRAKPSRTFALQTNGTLLKNHDLARLLKAGLNQVTISVDTLDSKTLRYLRGVNPKALIANVTSLRRNHPELELWLLATVTTINIQQIPDLIRFFLEIGVNRFTLHEVFHLGGTDNADVMQSLLLEDGAFHAMKENVMREFAGQADFVFAHDDHLERVSKKIAPSVDFRSRPTM